MVARYMSSISRECGFVPGRGAECTREKETRPRVICSVVSCYSATGGGEMRRLALLCNLHIGYRIHLKSYPSGISMWDTISMFMWDVRVGCPSRRSTWEIPIRGECPNPRLIPVSQTDIPGGHMHGPDGYDIPDVACTIMQGDGVSAYALRRQSSNFLCCWRPHAFECVNQIMRGGNEYVGVLANTLSL